MFQRFGIILDFPFIKNQNPKSLKKYQNILEICSIFIKMYNFEKPTSQMIILILKNQLIGQLTHLSGNLSHHYQGLWHLLFQKKKLNDLNQGFFFSDRSNILGGRNLSYELLFISEGTLDFLDSNFFTVFMGKKKRKFSVISLGIKSFALQILTKVTRGHYITLLSKETKILSKIFLRNFKKLNSSEIIHSLTVSFSFNRFMIQNLNLRGISKITNINMVKICRNCKNHIPVKSNRWCQNCGIFILHASDYPGMIRLPWDKSKSKIYFSFVFSLFCPILTKKKIFQNSHKKNFNFFYLGNKDNIDLIKTESKKNFSTNNHNEILIADYYS